MALLPLGGRPQPLKKPFQSQKGHFYEKMNALNVTKTPELANSAKESGNICDRLYHLSDKSEFLNGTTGISKNLLNIAQK